MVRFDTESIRRQAKADFQKSWRETADLNPASGESFLGGAGAAHPVHQLISKVRGILIKHGFAETENQLFIAEDDVYKQYGPEAPVILDRVYYLAGLPRPDIGLSAEKKKDLAAIADIDSEGLQKIFRRYRAGDIEGDDLLEVMVADLGLDAGQATRVIGLFPEFKNIEPQASKTTLRSHMTGAWFPTLAAMVDKAPLPVKLFSIGLRFRREQKVDATHLRAHYGASLVVMAEDANLTSGKEATAKILEELKFGDIRYVQKKATSNYYAPESEYEVYAGDIEVADIGMYSPVALANYDISYPVFNLGFGLERILMVKNDVEDIRKLLYTQLYLAPSFTDEELAEKISIALESGSGSEGRLASAIKETAVEHANESSPCSFKVKDDEGDAYYFESFGTAADALTKSRKVHVELVEREHGTQLLGPAALNNIYVHDSGVYGLPDDTGKLKQSMKDIKEKGVKLPWGFIDALSHYFASQIEAAVEAGEREGTFQVKMAKGPADVNIRVSEAARRFIESKNKPISVKGPVFTAVSYRVID